MSLLEQIDKAQIDEVIAFSQNIENPNTTTLLHDWAKAKTVMSQHFFNGKLSYTYPEKVRFELNDYNKEDKLNHFIDYVSNLFSNWRHPLVEFLEHLSPNEFYNNSLAGDYIIIEEEGKKISKGTKVVKSFKYFIEDTNLLHDLQNKASEIIQENKIEGYLTFSIHPLDFLSSSENTYNWRSCHALDGEYRAGNLSYMCDSSTMIVYLSSNEPMQLPHFPPSVPWNSKKWRVLLHFDEHLEVCFAGRQYPFSSEGALNTVKEIFSNEMAPYHIGIWGEKSHREKWNGWYNDYLKNALRADGEEEYIEESRYCIINHGVYDRCTIIHDAEESRHFNDLLRSSCYEEPYYMYKQYSFPHPSINIQVGAPVLCLHCGERIIETQDTMMCTNCECEFGDSDSEEYKTCDCCGTRFYWEEGYWVGDTDFVCPGCAATETFICEICNERYYNLDKHWDEKISGYVCNNCYEDQEEE